MFLGFLFDILHYIYIDIYISIPYNLNFFVLGIRNIVKFYLKTLFFYAWKPNNAAMFLITILIVEFNNYLKLCHVYRM